MPACYAQCHPPRFKDGLRRTASDVIRPGDDGSKIFVSIVYLWTGRGPEINNEDRRRIRGGAVVGTGRGPRAIHGRAMRGGVVAGEGGRRGAEGGAGRE